MKWFRNLAANAQRIKPKWERFIEQHAADIGDGKKFELPHPEITLDMFPEEYSISLSDGTSWPKR